MSALLTPFNLDLLIPTEADLRGLRPVKVADIFDGFSKNFHPDGLFSIETFGKVGDERRNRMYSFMDFRIPIFHPTIYKAIIDLKALYGRILAGREYAVFDPKTKDFIKSNVMDGETGYAFFLKHFPSLTFEERPSAQREVLIKLVDKYRDNLMISKLVVMPAGLRDYTVDENGKPSEDEVNALYRKVMQLSGSMDNVDLKVNADYFDAGRFNIQLAVQEIYEYVLQLLEGKKKLVLGHWAARKVRDTTRNVITSYIPEVETLFGERSVGANHTVIGMHQYMRASLPLTVKHVRDTYLPKVFSGPGTPALLVDPKTLHKVQVVVDSDDYDDWMTYEGIEKTCARFKEENLRHNPVMIGKYYLGLIYKGPDMTFKFMQDISELPEGRDPKDVYPITLAEILYISTFRKAATMPAFVTRYPITGYGSVYPSWVYLKSTVKGEIRTELGEDWEWTDNKSEEFPSAIGQFYNSQSPSFAHIGRLGAD